MSKHNPHEEHKTKAKRIKLIRCAILTVSDSRTYKTDMSGKLVHTLLESSGHEVTYYSIVQDEIWQVRRVIVNWVTDDKVDVIIINGSTGFSPRDIAFEAVGPLLEKELKGFGELFRSLSFSEIKSSAMMSQAFAGIANNKPIFCLPGSPHACQLAMEKFILPELRHIIWTVKGQK